MAFFALNSDITIGTFRFNGVHEVRIKRSMQHLADSAIITIPHKGNIQSTSHSFNNPVVFRTLINARDTVTINLGYNGNMQEEFRGFVKRVGRELPLQIECEGYIQELRLDVSYTAGSKSAPVNTTAKELLLTMLATNPDNDISVECPVDFNIKNFYATNADGVRVVDFIRQASDNALCIFFKEPDVLWCGLQYTPYAEADTSIPGSGGASNGNVFGFPTVSYRLGWNCVKDNGLKEREPSEPTQIILNGKLANGTVMHTASRDKAAAKKVVKLLNNVPDVPTMKSFAQENEFRINYTGMEGYINGFLQPYCLPGYEAYVVDTDDPEMTGTYLVESTEVTFGIRGARRKVVLGPKVNFSN